MKEEINYIHFLGVPDVSRKFNELIEHINALEKRVKDLEKENKPTRRTGIYFSANGLYE